MSRSRERKRRSTSRHREEKYRGYDTYDKSDRDYRNQEKYDRESNKKRHEKSRRGDEYIDHRLKRKYSDDRSGRENGEKNESKNVSIEPEELVLDESTILGLEKLITGDDTNEEEEAERLANDRRRRRLEILKKHGNVDVSEEVKSDNASSVPNVDGSNGVTFIINSASNYPPSLADELAAEKNALEEEAKNDATKTFDIFSTSPVSYTHLTLPTILRV